MELFGPAEYIFYVFSKKEEEGGDGDGDGGERKTKC